MNLLKRNMELLRPHPATRLLLLGLLAVAVQQLRPLALGLLGFSLVAVALWCAPRLLKKMLYRTRWLLLTMLLVFAFTTPGEYVPGWPLDSAPTYEGLASGLWQATRLVIMLAGLAWMLGVSSRDDLMAGIFLLLRPLRWLGLSPQRFSARLWLTLHYVEQMPQRNKSWSWDQLDALSMAPDAAPPQSLYLPMVRFSVLDGFCWLGIALALAWLLG